MYTITVKNYNAGYDIQIDTFEDINEYKITEDYLILESLKNKALTYILKDQVLEFEVNW
ncbi:MAG: hypothetical protein [Bacteriophage sp.]|nr:MAG: hypothetical protein [Bacteriophage sp.]UVM91557.1 MAG: hypothetical protein [Bacteriophage sp.]UVN01803.1 MAG: hypothetical protein [Bacteriophage sp.]UVX36044.1 MAG: hypothetical protein [Bacteriophage sp.]UVX80374.1 MAG: hypothetical protein [Bacteriophage sp.]